MSDRCYREDELEALAALSPDDVRLNHQARCGRCRALLATFREFQSPSLPPEAEEEKAVTEISWTLGRVIRDDVGATPNICMLERVRRILVASTLRPVWIAAAAVLLILTVRQVSNPLEESEIGSALRGESETEWISAEAALSENGNLQISWQPVADADAYRILILDTDLLEVERVDTGMKTFVSLPPSILDALSVRKTDLLWRVIALREGREVNRSALYSIAPTSP